MEKYFVESNGEKLYFYIQRKNVKNINLKVSIDKKVTVSIPMKMPLDKAKDFIKRKSDWIKKQQDYYNDIVEQKETLTFETGETIYLLGKQYILRITKDCKNNININNKYIEVHVKEKFIENKEYIRKIYEKWLKNYAFGIIEESVKKYYKILKKYDIKMPKIEIRKMKTRWGSCIPMNNKIIFNLNLIKSPICCIEYVVLHELSHFQYKNHSRSFYNFITIFMPDWKERKKILDEEFMGVVK